MATIDDEVRDDECDRIATWLEVLNDSITARSPDNTYAIWTMCLIGLIRRKAYRKMTWETLTKT